MGNTFRSALAHGIDVDVVDINASIPPLARFHQENPAATFDNPHGHIIINDGRNHLLMTQHRYDMITVDPAPPIWGTGMVNLHTQEFFELARDRLTDDGVMLMWALSNERDDFLGILAAFRKVFPYVAIYRGAYYTAYHMLGSKKPIQIDPARAQAVFALPAVRADINEIVTGQLTPDRIFSLLVAKEADVDEAIKGIQPLTDDHPTLEYRFIRAFNGQPFFFPSQLKPGTPAK
jgi:spermidine synthase